MPGTMSQADLVLDLRGMLADAANKFTGSGSSDFHRHLTIAAADLARFRPRTLVGEVTLVADQPNYDPPAGLIAPKWGLWGRSELRSRKPWQRGYVRQLPTLSQVETETGMQLWLDPAPTAEQIAALGSVYKFFYFAAHVVATEAASTTVKAADRHLLLLRATAHALLELANNGISKPVQLGSGGVGSMPKNGTPGALSEQLMQLYETMAA